MIPALFDSGQMQPSGAVSITNKRKLETSADPLGLPVPTKNINSDEGGKPNLILVNCFSTPMNNTNPEM